MFLTKLYQSILAAAALAIVPAKAQVFPDAQPASRSSAGIYTPRNLALGEPRFTDARVYNLFDQGGSPMGLLETHKERVSLGLGYVKSHRATSGDSLAIDHSDLAIPQLGFFQPGVFGANLYYLRESEAYHQKRGDSVENHSNLFGIDMAAGPASGLFRVGFSAHVRIGDIEYSGEAKRTLLTIPSLRFDLGSRLHPAVEMGLFAGFNGRFDSLQNPAGHLERTAAMSLPRYGVLADVGGTESLPLLGNTVVELGTDREFGEYRPANDSGVLYPTIWTGYWTFQTQWMYPLQAGDFRLQPALRFAQRSEKAQGYAGIKSNQNPLKKGAKIDSIQWTRSITDFGLGGQVSFREMVSLLAEWETAGHTFKSDSTQEERYHRFSFGLEHHVHRLPIDFPEAMSLTLRTGWTWRQDGRKHPGYHAFQFDPFLPSPLPNVRSTSIDPKPDAPFGYSAFSIGFGLGFLEEMLGMEGYLTFPGQSEVTRNGSQKTSGMEFGMTVTYKVL